MFRLVLSEGLWLEQVETRHADALSSLVTRCHDRLAEWETWPALAATPSAARRWVTDLREENAHNRGFTCGVWKDAGLVGLVALGEVNAENLSASLWGFVCPEVEGSGDAGRACVGILNFAFGELALARVTYYCARDNHRSARLAARLGFTHEGVLSSWRLVGGKLLDFHVHGLLRGDWVRARREFLHLRVRKAAAGDRSWLSGLFGEDVDPADGERPVWMIPGKAAARLTWIEPGLPLLDRFALAEPDEDGGAGRTLLRVVEAELRVLGSSVLATTVPAGSAPGHCAFLRENGFRPVAGHTWSKGL